MGKCASSPPDQDQQATCDTATWLQNVSNGTMPPTYVRVIVRHHASGSNISGYYRNISTDYPQFNETKHSSPTTPVYIRVLDIEGQEIKPYTIHYLYSRELIQGYSWVIAGYNALVKHPQHGYVLCGSPYHNFKHYFSGHSDMDEKETTQVANLEHHQYNQDKDHTNIYKMFSNDSRQCDTCMISIIPLNNKTTVSQRGPPEQFIDTVFNNIMTRKKLLYFDAEIWHNTTNDKINLYNGQRKHIYDTFFGNNSDENKKLLVKYKHLKSTFDEKRLKELGINKTLEDEYNNIIDNMKGAICELNPSERMVEIVENEENYKQIIGKFMENIKSVVGVKGQDKEVLNMVFPYMYKENDKPWKDKST